MRILLIEDDEAITRVLQRGLYAHGHQMVIAETGEDGVLLADDDTVELVLLDISLPGLNGHQVLERIRARRTRLPIIMLTARDDLKNKVSALHAGADDYLTKPFAFEELLARIRAVTRRLDQPESSQLQAGSVRLDLLAQRAWRDDSLIDLSKREFALLEYFMRHPHQVLSREQILLAVWDYDFDPRSKPGDTQSGRYLARGHQLGHAANSSTTTQPGLAATAKRPGAQGVLGLHMKCLQALLTVRCGF